MAGDGVCVGEFAVIEEEVGASNVSTGITNAGGHPVDDNWGVFNQGGGFDMSGSFSGGGNFGRRSGVEEDVAWMKVEMEEGVAVGEGAEIGFNARFLSRGESGGGVDVGGEFVFDGIAEIYVVSMESEVDFGEGAGVSPEFMGRF